MSKTREAIYIGIGILAGIALSGPAVQAATTTITAEPSSQAIYVDGALVEMEAYGRMAGGRAATPPATTL